MMHPQIILMGNVQLAIRLKAGEAHYKPMKERRTAFLAIQTMPRRHIIQDNAQTAILPLQDGEIIALVMWGTPIVAPVMQLKRQQTILTVSVLNVIQQIIGQAVDLITTVKRTAYPATQMMRHLDIILVSARIVIIPIWDG